MLIFEKDSIYETLCSVCVSFCTHCICDEYLNFISMGESFQDYSYIQDFEADFS